MAAKDSSRRQGEKVEVCTIIAICLLGPLVAIAFYEFASAMHKPEPVVLREEIDWQGEGA